MLLNDLLSHVRNHETEIQQAVSRVLKRGWLVLGPEVAEFEAAFAGFVGVAHGVGVANGTDALELALRALGVTRGTRVATVANAGGYTCTALLAIGAEPVFMDVRADTRNVSLEQVNAALASGVGAVVVTHLYGLAVPDTEAIAARCAEYGVPLLEDCAQAHGAMLNGRRVGSFGRVAAFSFYPTKNLGAMGDGGAILTDDADLAGRLRALRQYGWSQKYHIGVEGGRNSRLDEMQAAVLAALLPNLDESNERRRAVFRAYDEGIVNPAVTLPLLGADDNVGHLYVVQTGRRDSLQAHLKGQDIASDVHYPVPDHRQPVFAARFQNLRLPVTEKLAAQVLTLPCYPEMTAEQVNQVIEAVNAWNP